MLPPPRMSFLPPDARPSLTFSVFNHLGDTWPKPLGSWEEFIGKLKLKVTPNKEDVQLYCPATFLPGQTRAIKNVLYVSFGVIDIDKATQAQVEASLQILQELGLEFLLHTTHSHASGLKEGFFKCRILIRFDRPVEVDEWDKVWYGMNEIVGFIADPKCRHPATFYFFPSCSPGEEQRALIFHNPGKPLYVQNILDADFEVPKNAATIEGPDAETLARIETSLRYQLCEAAIDSYPPAIQGEHGDDRTYHAAHIGMDFGLTSEEFWPLFLKYNQRCQPPWEEKELEKKIRSAEKGRKLPIGWRLVETTPLDAVQESDLEKLITKLGTEGIKGRKGRLLRLALDKDAPEPPDQAGFEELAKILATHFTQADSTHLAHFFATSINKARFKNRDCNEKNFSEWIREAQRQVFAKDARKLLEKKKQQSESVAEAFRHVGINRTTPYTQTEIADFAKENSETVHSFKFRWVLRKDKAFFFFVGGKYIGPYTNNEATNVAQRLLSPTGFDLHDYDGKVPRMLSISEITERYGTVFSEFVTDMTVQKSFYVSAQQKFIEASCPMKKIEARENPYVAEWLLRITEDKEAHGKILDWLACLPMIDKTCAALFFYGEKGVGKSLFAHACSRLWSQEGPTEIDDISGNFNAALARCPLVFADELIPEDNRGEPRTDLLRRLIQDHVRTYRRKFLPESKLVGAIRLVIATNNLSILVSERKALTNQDIEAINDRFILVPVTTKKAGEYLENLDPAQKDHIKFGTALVEHALYLNATRNVTPGPRFLVQGSPNSELESILTTSTGLRSEVSHWISSYIMNPSKIATSGERPRVTGDATIGITFLVTAKILHNFWAIYCKEGPSVGAIEKALGGISDRRQIGTDKYRAVNLGRVRYWAELNGVCSGEKFDAELIKLAQNEQRKANIRVISNPVVSQTNLSQTAGQLSTEPVRDSHRQENFEKL
jgi:hypothetical protein